MQETKILSLNAQRILAKFLTKHVLCAVILNALGLVSARFVLDGRAGAIYVTQKDNILIGEPRQVRAVVHWVYAKFFT
jgi:hypothetical protein